MIFMDELEALIVLLRSSQNCEFLIPSEWYRTSRYDELKEAEDYLTSDETVRFSKYYTENGFKVVVEKIQP